MQVADWFDGIDLSHWTGHTLSVLATLGSILGFLPAVAALAAGIWYTIQIWESATLQKWLYRHRIRSNARRVKSLRRQKIHLQRVIQELDDTIAEAERDTPSSPSSS